MFLTWIFSDSAVVISQGFMLCASTIIAIGPQNLFILRQGLTGQHLMATALLCTLADLLLISIGVGGLGSYIQNNELLFMVATWGGAAFLLGYGANALRSAWQHQPNTLPEIETPNVAGLGQTTAAILTISLLNPAAYLDTILLIGTMSGQFPVDQRVIFGIGAVIASGLWFFLLTYGSSHLKPFFSRPIAWRTLDVVSGCIMCGIAISMCGISTLFA